MNKIGLKEYIQDETMRNMHIVQPYEVGSNESKSLAIVIPSAIRRKNHIDSSTVFLISSNDSEIVLHLVDIDKKKIPANQSFAAKDQQVSIVTEGN